MNEEKRMILEMLKDGKISTEEAEKLLDALGKTKESTGSFYSGRSSSKKEINLEQIMQKISGKLDEMAVKLGGNEGDSFSKTIGNIGVEVGSAVSDLGKDLGQAFEGIVLNVKDFAVNSNNKEMETIQSAIEYDLSGVRNPTLDFKAVNGGIILKSSKEAEKLSLNVTASYKRKEISPGEKLFDFYLEDDRLIFSPRFSGVSIAIEGIIPRMDYDKIYLQTKNGGLAMKGVSCDLVNFETTNGRILLKGISAKNIELSTKNGRIEFEKIGANEINAQTSNGKLKLANVDCPLINCRTSNSSVEAYSVRSDDLVLKTTNSSLVADSILSERILLYTTNGKVELTNYDEESVSEIDLQTTNGSIKIDKTPKYKPSKYMLETSMGSIEINKDRLIYSTNTHVNYGMKKVEAESTDYLDNEDRAIVYKAATSNGSIKIG